MDSNHRSDKQQIYSLSPLATREFPHIQFSGENAGAGRRTRTPDLLITNQLLYRLSYTGDSRGTIVLYHGFSKSQALFLKMRNFLSKSQPLQKPLPQTGEGEWLELDIQLGDNGGAAGAEALGVGVFRVHPAAGALYTLGFGHAHGEVG